MSWPTTSNRSCPSAAINVTRSAASVPASYPSSGLVGEPGPARVDGDDGVPAGERGHHLPPGVPGLGPPADQQQRGGPSTASDGAQPQAVHLHASRLVKTSSEPVGQPQRTQGCHAGALRMLERSLQDGWNVVQDVTDDHGGARASTWTRRCDARCTSSGAGALRGLDRSPDRGHRPRAGARSTAPSATRAPSSGKASTVRADVLTRCTSRHCPARTRAQAPCGRLPAGRPEPHRRPERSRTAALLTVSAAVPGAGRAEWSGGWSAP